MRNLFVFYLSAFCMVGQSQALGFTSNYEINFNAPNAPHYWYLKAAGVFVPDNNIVSIGTMYESPFGTCVRFTDARKIKDNVYEAHVGGMTLRTNIVGQSRVPISLNAYRAVELDNQKVEQVMDTYVVLKNKTQQEGFGIFRNWALPKCFIAHRIVD